jgi:hypothetical protein
MNELKDDRIEQYDNLFDEYLNANENDKTKNKFETINNNVKVLNLPNNKDVLTKYKEYLMNPFKLNDHMNIIRLLKSDEYIKNKLNKINEQNQKIKVIDNVYNKISILRKLEKSLFLKPLQVNYSLDSKIDIVDKEWTLIKKLFRKNKDKPENMTEFKPLYISMIKNICNSDIICDSRERDGKKQIRVYNLNHQYILEQIELNKYSNPKTLNFDHHFIELFKIEPVNIETVNESLYDLDIDIWDE